MRININGQSNGYSNGNGHVNGNGFTNGNGVHHTNGETKPIAGAAKLRQKLEDTNDLIVCPGVYDGLSARIALNLGFEAMYMVRVCMHTPFINMHILTLTLSVRRRNHGLTIG